MAKLINSFMSTYMGDYNWPYLPSHNYRPDGECYYYPTVYNPMDYYLNLPSREDLQYSCKTGMSEHFAPCRVQTKEDPRAYHQTGKPAGNPYNNLHCTCVECMREMRCAEARVELPERYPFIYKPEDKQLTHRNEMMARVKKDRFCSVYEHSYAKDPCKLFRFHNTVPCEEPRIERGISHEEDRPECFALQKPRNPLEFRNYPSAKTTPAFKPGKTSAPRHSSTATETITRPWHSEYMDGISKVGGTIIEEQLHWPNKRSAPSRHDP